MKTYKMNKVLVALDYDPTAKKVAEVGYSLAKAMNAETILLHVIADPVYYSTVDYSPIMGLNNSLVVEPSQLDTLEHLVKISQLFLDTTKRHLGDKTIQTLVKDGDFAESILETAKHVHANIIVMGSHSHKWLEKILMGSVTEQVLRNTQVPLFIVPTSHT